MRDNNTGARSVSRMIFFYKYSNAMYTQLCACFVSKGVEWSSTHASTIWEKRTLFCVFLRRSFFIIYMLFLFLLECRKTEDFVKIFLSFTQTLQGLTTFWHELMKIIKEYQIVWEYFILNTKKNKNPKEKRERELRSSASLKENFLV